MSYDDYQDKATDQVGLSRAVSLIRTARGEVPNSVSFDNGDLLQGSPMGDHEFNFGLPFLRRSLRGANFPYVNANVFLDDKDKDSTSPTHAFTPYVVLERQFRDVEGRTHAMKGGVIGFVPPRIMQWDRANLVGRVVVRDMVEMAAKCAPKCAPRGPRLCPADDRVGRTTPTSLRARWQSSIPPTSTSTPTRSKAVLLTTPSSSDEIPAQPSGSAPRQGQRRRIGPVRTRPPDIACHRPMRYSGAKCLRSNLGADILEGFSEFPNGSVFLFV